MPQLPYQMVKAGFYGKQQVQRWKCQQCGKRLSEPPQRPFNVDVRVPHEKVAMILHCLVEGNSVRSAARLCDVEKRTVLTLLKLAGERCERFMENVLRDVPVRDLELDECWSYVLKKEGHKLPHEANDERIGDQYIFIGLERNSKLVIAWHLGKRDRDKHSSSSRKCVTRQRERSMFRRTLGPPTHRKLTFNFLIEPITVLWSRCTTNQKKRESDTALAIL